VNSGKTLFAQLMDFLPWSTFSRIVTRYGGDQRVRTLSCAEHYRAMAFAQLLLAQEVRFATDSPLEGTGFELPVRERGQSGCRPFYAAECSRRVGAPSQFSDSTTPCIKAAWTRPPRPQSVPATHSAEFCVVREKTATLYRVTAPADPVHGNRLGGAKGPQPVPLQCDAPPCGPPA